MSVRYPDHLSDISGISARFIASGYGQTAVLADLATIVTALGSDTTTHDQTREATPLALRLDASHSKFMNAVLLAQMRAKCGNLVQNHLISACNNAVPASVVASAPANIFQPFIYASATPGIVGTVLTGTGKASDWANTPTSYTYQWVRDGTNIASNGTSATYTLVSADVGGHIITLKIVAVNATGSSPACLSNGIYIP